MITGSLPAIPTPMQDDGSLDIPALKRMLDWHVAEGTDGIVVVGAWPAEHGEYGVPDELLARPIEPLDCRGHRHEG